MKTITHLKYPSRRQFPSLALLLAAGTLLAFAPQPVRAGPSYPFHARFITEFEIVVEPPYVHYTVNCQGHATYMGPTTAAATDQLVSMIDRSATATYTLTSGSAGVREDTLILAMTFQATDVPGGIIFTGTYTVTGGTGRFAGVTGSGVVAGSALLNGPHSGIGSSLSLWRNHLRTGGLKQTGIDPGPKSIPGPGSEQDTLTRARNQPHDSRTLLLPFGGLGLYLTETDGIGAFAVAGTISFSPEK